VSIFNKRNALVGFVTLKAASRARRRMLSRKQKRSAWKLPVLLGLGIVSFGVLAVLVAVMLRRQREPEHIEGFVVADKDESLMPSAYAELTPEPFPAA
jgi:hypothetical protein